MNDRAANPRVACEIPGCRCTAIWPPRSDGLRLCRRCRSLVREGLFQPVGYADSHLWVTRWGSVLEGRPLVPARSVAEYLRDPQGTFTDTLWAGSERLQNFCPKAPSEGVDPLSESSP